MLNKFSFIIVLLLTSNSLSAAENIETLCQQDSVNCLVQIDKRLENSTENSFNWMRLKLLQIDAMFALEQHQKLFDLLLTLEKKANLPTRLRLKVYIYLAKMNAFWGHQEKSLFYQGNVKGLLGALAKDTQHPESLIEYANFQIYLNNYPHGIEIFEQLEARFEYHSNHEIRKSIYTNLGNLHSLNQDKITALKYFIKANQSAQLTPNKQYELMTEYNVARGYQMTDQHKSAINRFKRVIKKSIEAKHTSLVDLSHFRLSELHLLSHANSEAANHLKLVDTKQLSKIQLDDYKKMARQLGLTLPE